MVVNNQNGSFKLRTTCIIIILLVGLLFIMAPGAAAMKLAVNQVDDGERPSAEVIQEIKHLLLNKIGVVSPPPPTDGASLMSDQEAKAYSIRNWRRNTRPHPEQMETVSSTLSAQVAFNGNFIFNSSKSFFFFVVYHFLKKAPGIYRQKVRKSRCVGYFKKSDWLFRKLERY